MHFRPEFSLEEEPIRTFGVEEYISTKYFTPFDHSSMAHDPPNPRMGCTIVTQLASSRAGQAQDAGYLENGSLRSGQSADQSSTGVDYLADLTENHYTRGASPSPLPPVRSSPYPDSSAALQTIHRFIKMSGSRFILDPMCLEEGNISSPLV